MIERRAHGVFTHPSGRSQLELQLATPLHEVWQPFVHSLSAQLVAPAAHVV